MSAPPSSLSADPSIQALIRSAKEGAVEQDLDNLPLKPSSASERRCPFLTTYSEKLEVDVDDVCDVRIQTFSDVPPFGPTHLEMCELCLRAKTYEIQSGQAEMMAAAAESTERAMKAPAASTPRETGSYR